MAINWKYDKWNGSRLYLCMLSFCTMHAIVSMQEKKQQLNEWNAEYGDAMKEIVCVCVKFFMCKSSTQLYLRFSRTILASVLNIIKSMTKEWKRMNDGRTSNKCVRKKAEAFVRQTTKFIGREHHEFVFIFVGL